MFSVLYQMFFSKAKYDKKDSTYSTDKSNHKMVNCIGCKKLISHEHKFCGYCGKKQDKEIA